MRYIRFFIASFIFLGIFYNTYQLYHTQKRIKALEQMIVSDKKLSALMHEHNDEQARSLEALKSDLIEKMQMIFQEYKNEHAQSLKNTGQEAMVKSEESVKNQDLSNTSERDRTISKNLEENQFSSSNSQDTKISFLSRIKNYFSSFIHVKEKPSSN